MDKVAQANLISLLVALPDADERNLLVAELVGPEAVRPPKAGASPAEHAAQVVAQLVEGRANLEDLFEILNDRHPGLGARIARTADLVLEPGDDDTDGEARTEMLMPVTPPSGIRQIAILICDTHTALANHPVSRPCIEYADVRSHLVGGPDDQTDPGWWWLRPRPRPRHLPPRRRPQLRVQQQRERGAAVESSPW